MKKLLVYLLIFSFIGEIAPAIRSNILAQEIPTFSLDFGVEENPAETETTSTPNTDTQTNITGGATNNNVDMVTSDPPNTVLNNQPLSNQSQTPTTTLSQTTTLSSSHSSGGSNPYQTIRRSFSAPKTNSTVSINDAIARNTTLSNSLLLAQSTPPLAEKKISTNTLKREESIVAVSEVPFPVDNIKVASAAEIDSLETISIKSNQAEKTPTKRLITDSTKATIESKQPTIFQKITQSFTPEQNTPIKSTSFGKTTISISTVPKAFQSTTLTAQTKVEKSISKYQWIQRFKKAWHLVIRLFQLGMIGWLTIILFQKYHKKLALRILNSQRRKKQNLFATKNITPNIVPKESWQFQSKKIRSMRPNRPYYQFFSTNPS